MPRPRTAAAAAAMSAAALLLVGCGAVGGGGAAERLSAVPIGAPSTTSVASPAVASAAVEPPTASSAMVTATLGPPGTASDNRPPPATAEPSPDDPARTRPAVLAIPSIGVEELRVVPYEGTTDDWPGTRIQDRGVAASPYGEEGGVGPGEVGNYLVTAHRLSAGGPLRALPELRPGDTVRVTSGGTVHAYRITETRQTSFRSKRSLAEQRAPVPGEPGERATRAMITLSTCATPEDDAAGNHWRDEKGNPEHRIDKIGVLVSSKKA
ncbi:class E sortase [Streptomyces sp. NPDC047097]|uniref:class E sortase n=1 Tax=Streptomyces sp. NPDC047097 TaxID=3155260 RepID=UPI0033CB3777